MVNTPLEARDYHTAYFTHLMYKGLIREWIYGGILPQVIRSWCAHHHHHHHHKVFARLLGVERSLSRSQARAVGWPALGSGIRQEAPLAPSLATFDRPAATPGT